MAQQQHESEPAASTRPVASAESTTRLAGLVWDRQALLVWLYAICGLYTAYMAIHQPAIGVVYLIPILATRSTLRVARQVDASGLRRALIVVAVLIPLLNILVLVWLAYSTTELLRNAGYTVDFFVGPKAD